MLMLLAGEDQGRWWCWSSKVHCHPGERTHICSGELRSRIKTRWSSVAPIRKGNRADLKYVRLLW